MRWKPAEIDGDQRRPTDALFLETRLVASNKIFFSRDGLMLSNPSERLRLYYQILN